MLRWNSSGNARRPGRRPSVRKLLLALALLLPLSIASDTVLCFEADGRVTVENYPLNCCVTVADEGGVAALAGQTPCLTISTGCAPCRDVVLRSAALAAVTQHLPFPALPGPLSLASAVGEVPDVPVLRRATSNECAPSYGALTAQRTVVLLI